VMTPKLDVRGIIAGHFDMVTKMSDKYKPGETVKASYNEIKKVLDLMGIAGEYPVYMGAGEALTDEKTPHITEGAKFIIEEAMREDERPLYIGCQGSITDLACAILMEPRICDKMTAIWIGGGDYPKGGFEFNLIQDVIAANVVFSSSMPLWQIPMKVYKTLSVSLAELQYKVKPCGEIGKYLYEKMLEVNKFYEMIPHWPHGELWGLGDQGIIAVLMQESERVDNFHMVPAPRVDEKEYFYIEGSGKEGDEIESDEIKSDEMKSDGIKGGKIKANGNREIRVYDYIDYRLTLEDFFAKLSINYPRSF
ncbi:nucleoside hydrolase, partial [Lachnospiraceae bacterium OttesenSCG-928-D06]|nr:nucleoside hydrolase [Lachnospiraceae bacterium OttesenSCG-928-D06]